MTYLPLLTPTEAMYMQAIAQCSPQNSDLASTTALAKVLNTTPASVTDMLQKLAKKKVVIYQKYQGVRLTPAGQKQVRDMLRKERLWLVFLIKTLKINWEDAPILGHTCLCTP